MLEKVQHFRRKLSENVPKLAQVGRKICRSWLRYCIMHQRGGICNRTYKSERQTGLTGKYQQHIRDHQHLCTEADVKYVESTPRLNRKNETKICLDGIFAPLLSALNCCMSFCSALLPAGATLFLTEQFPAL